jgi:hypothetical protein
VSTLVDIVGNPAVLVVLVVVIFALLLWPIRRECSCDECFERRRKQVAERQAQTDEDNQWHDVIRDTWR